MMMLRKMRILMMIKMTKTTNNAKDDKEQSGLYMIKELCHHFDTMGSYTSLTLIKDTFGSK